jgi:fructose transport system substrate-binding protein
MENCLQKNGDVNVVYTINEPAAAGAYNALKKAGKEKNVIIVSWTAAARASRTWAPA